MGCQKSAKRSVHACLERGVLVLELAKLGPQLDALLPERARRVLGEEPPSAIASPAARADLARRRCGYARAPTDARGAAVAQRSGLLRQGLHGAMRARSGEADDRPA